MKPEKAHWSEGLLEPLVSFSKSDDLPITIHGGSEIAEFPYIFDVTTNEITYHSGDQIVRDAIVLEIQGKNIGGYTLYDSVAWLRQCAQFGNRVQLKLVQPGRL